MAHAARGYHALSPRLGLLLTCCATVAAITVFAASSALAADSPQIARLKAAGITVYARNGSITGIRGVQASVGQDPDLATLQCGYGHRRARQKEKQH